VRQDEARIGCDAGRTVELNPEHGAGQDRSDGSFDFDRLFRIHNDRRKPAFAVANAGRNQIPDLPAIAGKMALAPAPVRAWPLFASPRFIYRKIASREFLAV
jgi:hypothetical protein